MPKIIFEWDPDKDNVNRRKHGIPFLFARRAFEDPRRVIARDLTHSDKEEWGDTIRIIGAGYWRKGKTAYEKENKMHG